MGISGSIKIISPRRLGPTSKVAKIPMSAMLCESENHILPYASTRMSRKSPSPPHRL